MQSWIYRFILIVLSLFSFSAFGEVKILNPKDNRPLLVWDNWDVENNSINLPRNFRTTQRELDLSEHPSLSLKGFRQLNASGSGQFLEEELKHALEQMRGEIWIVDLRQESHGFIDGRPFSWYAYENRGNEHKTGAQIQALENTAIHQLKKQRVISVHLILDKQSGHIYRSKPETIISSNIKSEAELVQSLGLSYKRFYVQDRHPPDDEEVDTFVAWAKTLPKNAWLHFHCRAGSGRTSTFLIMYDILKNATLVSFEDIIERNALAGSKDLSKIPTDEPEWLIEAAKARFNFVKEFYDYIKSQQSKTWSEWKAEQEAD